MKHIKLYEQFVNEAKEIDNDYTFGNLDDYYKAVGVLYRAGFYRSGSGNPPTGNEPGSYQEDENWLNIKVIRGEKEALKIFKKSKIYFNETFNTKEK